MTNVRAVESWIDMTNRLFYTLNKIQGGNKMETIPGHDEWKTESPEDYVEEAVISTLEKTLAACPFCARRPFFEDAADTDLVFVTCNCGLRLEGRDWHDVTAKWNTRPPAPVARKVLREGPRSFWPGA